LGADVYQFRSNSSIHTESIGDPKKTKTLTSARKIKTPPAKTLIRSDVLSSDHAFLLMRVG
jgi:hypothetical protein